MENRDDGKATTDAQGGQEAWLGSEVGDPSLRGPRSWIADHSQYLKRKTGEEGLGKAGLSLTVTATLRSWGRLLPGF